MQATGGGAPGGRPTGAAHGSELELQGGHAAAGARGRIATTGTLEPAMDFDGGFGGGAAAEDNLSMPLGDFMAFLDSDPAAEEDGEDHEANQSFENGFETHEDPLEDKGLWSNYSHADHPQYQMESMMEQGDGTFDNSDAMPYGFLDNDLSGNSWTNNHDNQPLPRKGHIVPSKG